MSRLEAARIELEAVRTEVERHQAENVKLREARPEQAEAVDRAAEVERLKELYAQALRDIQAKDEQVEVVRHELDNTRQRLKHQETAAQELQSKCQALEETCDTVHAQVSRARQEGELECLRAVESERAKWEARKELACQVCQIRREHHQNRRRKYTAKSQKRHGHWPHFSR